jgi:hypothetical protein
VCLSVFGEPPEAWLDAMADGASPACRAAARPADLPVALFEAPADLVRLTQQELAVDATAVRDHIRAAHLWTHRLRAVLDRVAARANP